MRKRNGCDNVPPGEFLHNRVYVWQVVAIVEVRKACPTDDPFELSLRPPLNVRVHRHREDKGPQRG